MKCKQEERKQKHEKLNKKQVKNRIGRFKN